MRFRQIATLFSCLFLIGSAEVVAGPMMQFMGRHFGVHSTAIAYLPAAYGLTYGAVALIAGPLSDRWGRKRPLQIGLAGFALFSAAIPSAPSLAVAIVLSALSGVCAAIVQPNALALVSDESAPEHAGRHLGQVFLGLMLAFVLTPALAGWLAEQAGWASAYYALAGLALAVALGVERGFGAHRPAAHGPGDFFATHREALRVPGVRRRLMASYLWLGWVAGFGAVVAEVAARKIAISPTDAGLLAGFFGGMAIVGNLCSARLQAALGATALPLAALAGALGLIGLALPVHALWQIAVLGTPWAFGYGCAGPLHHARLSALSAQWRGTINSYHASLLNLGIFSVSFLLGAQAPGAGMGLFCGIAGAVALAGAALLFPWGRPSSGTSGIH